MAPKRARQFNSKTFLALVDGGKKVLSLRKNQVLYSQGDAADAVFYIQEGQVEPHRFTAVAPTRASAEPAEAARLRQGFGGHPSRIPPRLDSRGFLRRRVKLTVVSPQGKEAVVAILEPEAFLGEACLVGQAVRLETATAVGAARVTRIDKAVMIRVLHEEPTFAELFLSYLLSRNIRIQIVLHD